MIFLKCVATMHHLNYSGQEYQNQFAVYDSDMPVTFKVINVIKPGMNCKTPKWL